MVRNNTPVLSKVNTYVVCGDNTFVLMSSGMKLKYGDRLRKSRKHKKLSQEGLAELSGVGQGTISKIERGDQESSIYDAILAHHLEVNALWLSTGDERFEPVWLGGDYIEGEVVRRKLESPQAESVQSQIDHLMLDASPRTQSILQILLQAERDGTLTNEDTQLLQSIAKRLTNNQHKTTQAEPGYGKLLAKAEKDHPIK